VISPSSKGKILLIDNDQPFLELIGEELKSQHYDVCTANDPARALALNKQEKPDIIVLDILLRRFDGVILCQQLRADTYVPILILTVLADLKHKITSFEAGADDYLVKPFELAEFCWRIKSLLRRNSQASMQILGEVNLSTDEILHAGEITLVPESREAVINGDKIHLTPIEFEILYCLMQNPGKTVSPSKLLKDVWGHEPDDDIETIRVHIRHLRQRLDEYAKKTDTPNKKFVRTIYGKGYQLIPEGFIDE